MTAPHVPSDNAAIEAAHAKVRETADLRLLTVIGQYIAKPNRWNREIVLGAMQAVEDEHYADMERRLNRAPGSLGRPSGGGALIGCVEAWEDSRGQFAGLCRGKDGLLQPAAFTCPNLGHVCRPDCHAWDGARCHNVSLSDIYPPQIKPPQITHDMQPANREIRKACATSAALIAGHYRGQADFAPPVTMHGDTGPLTINPEDAGDGA
jgi:hypothetical protein